MKLVDKWVHEEITPIPQKEIIKEMAKNDIKDFTTAGAIKTLLLKGYLRKAQMSSHSTYYVQLRRI